MINVQSTLSRDGSGFWRLDTQATILHEPYTFWIREVPGVVGALTEGSHLVALGQAHGCIRQVCWDGASRSWAREPSVQPLAVLVGQTWVPVMDRVVVGLGSLGEILSAWGPPDGEPAHFWCAENDPGGPEQVVHYGTVAQQRNYVHRVCADRIALGRALRARLPSLEGSRPLISVGSGPCVELLGWCLDRPWSGQIQCMDPMGWEGVLSDASWKSLCGKVLGDYEICAGRYIPEGPRPVPLARFSALQTLCARSVPKGAVLLLSHVLSELFFGCPDPEQMESRVLSWLNGLKQEGRAIIIVDDPEDSYVPKHFWTRLTGVKAEEGDFGYGDLVRELEDLYSSDLRDRRMYPQVHRARASVVVACHGGRWQRLQAEVGREVSSSYEERVRGVMTVPDPNPHNSRSPLRDRGVGPAVTARPDDRGAGWMGRF